MRATPYSLGLAAGAIVFAAIASFPRHYASAQDSTGPAPEAARVDFDHPGAGTPVVEVDLPAGLFGDVIGLGDAAIAGVAEAIQGAHVSDPETQADVKLAAEQIAAIRAIIGSVQGVLGEVRVRVYADTEGMNVGGLVAHYSDKLQGSAWTKIVQAREDDAIASVFVLRDSGAIRGVFVIATEGRELVLANVLCDVSPERIKEITRQATSIGLELAGEDALRGMLNEIRGRREHRVMPAAVTYAAPGSEH
jgi:hypothetical protein